MSLNLDERLGRFLIKELTLDVKGKKSYLFTEISYK